MQKKSECLIQSELISVVRFLETGLIDGVEPIDELSLLFHIVNEGKRSMQEGASLKRQGMKSGIPDLCFPIASQDGKFCGLWLEMKTDIGKLSQSQIEYIGKLKKHGNRVEVCRTSKSAIKSIMEHLGRYDVVKLIDEDYDAILNPI